MSQRVLDEHLGYWLDTVKLDRYRKALTQTIQPGARVLDLGSGTGLLALLACEAGAAHVIAVESGPLVAPLRTILERNGVADRVEIVHAMSTDLALETPVDVIVGDQLGGFAYTSGAHRYYADAAKRLLSPRGVTIPRSIDLLVAGVEDAGTRSAIEGFTDPIEYDLEALAWLSANTLRVVRLPRSALLTEPIGIHHSAASDTQRFRVSLTLEARRDGRLDGLLGMFRAELAPGTTISNVPGAADQLQERWQDVLPLREPLQLRCGDRFEVELLINPDTYLTTWRVGRDLVRAPTHSTFHGRILNRRELRKLTGRQDSTSAEATVPLT